MGYAPHIGFLRGLVSETLYASRDLITPETRFKGRGEAPQPQPVAQRMEPKFILR